MRRSRAGIVYNNHNHNSSRVTKHYKRSFLSPPGGYNNVFAREGTQRVSRIDAAGDEKKREAAAICIIAGPRAALATYIYI